LQIRLVSGDKRFAQAFFKSWASVNAFFDTIQSPGVAHLAATTGMTIGLIVFFVFLATRLSTSQLALQFDDLNRASRARGRYSAQGGEN